MPDTTETTEGTDHVPAPTGHRRSHRRAVQALAVIVLASAAVLAASGCSRLAGGPPKVAVSAAASDPALVGKTVQVDGLVIPSSWNGGVAPARFTLQGTEVKGLGVPDLAVVYDARASRLPTDFGGNTELIVTGTVQKDGVMKATSVKDRFASPYSSPPMTVAYLNVRSQQISGGGAQIVGYVVPGSVQTPASNAPNAPWHFVLEDRPPSGYTLPVNAQEAAMADPSIVHSGNKLLVTGAAARDGTFWAASIVPAP